ncbi:acyl-CoA dehydrogenase family protein [Nocardioides taihuensis]|uniref:Acyl-CoA dehydrogenase family protein n=1 Tax=Nocardioides taihuensis TaxID=1835606 RepID=A0ABW0BNH7_9ACTN
MTLGLDEEHRELGASLRAWAAGLDGPAAVRAAEGDPAETFEKVRAAAAGMGLAGLALPASAGGDDGSPLDVAVALEACAHALLPGPLLGPAVSELLLAGGHPGSDAVVGLAPGAPDLVWDAPSATHLLLPAPGEDDTWVLVEAAAVDVEPVVALDLSRRFGRVRAPWSGGVAVTGLTRARVRRTTVAMAAAEASGVARWCLETATSYAGVREQFGKPIGSFQAVKHLCAEMLETAEAVTAAAWDAAVALAADEEQAAFAADVAGAVALDGAVRVAQTCIQVLGGIGFTFEHDAHLYLRRATTLRALLGGGDVWAASLAARAASGVRRRVEVDLGGRDAGVRDEFRTRVAEVAALPEDARRAALVERGYLTPHWPAPYGLGADPVTQLVVDEELVRAGIGRPDLKIGGWAAPTVLEHGTDAQRERFVRPTLTGEIGWCQLFSEPGAGSDLASLRTRAVRDEAAGGWRLTGQKVWTSLAHEADWAICLARTDPDAPRHRGITYFLVDMGSPGIEIRPLRELTGDAMFNEVFLDDVLVPDDCVVGQPGDGWRLARTTLANERVAMASSRLGVSTERAVALAGDATPAEQVRVGHAVALATVCTLLGVRTTLRSLAGHGPGAESSVAKLLGVRSRQDASELVVELLGERVVLEADDPQVAADVHEMLMTRCLSIAGGTTQVLRTVAAERILGLPR